MLSASSIAENSAAGSIVGTLSATDLDAGDKVSFSITAGDTNLFEIDGSNQIVLKMGASLDFETASSHTLTVQASDNLLNTDQTFTIAVQDVFEVQTSLALSSLDGTKGFKLDGINSFDYSGQSVSSAGDINGDGYQDLIIGAPGANGRAGETYVVFGSSSASSAISLNDLNGTNGFRLTGIDGNDSSGKAVSLAGDFNGDGYDDLLIGALGADPGGNFSAGETYLVFGSSSLPASLNLSSLDGSNGFRLDGIKGKDYSGGSVSNAGDVNGDGYEDLIIGAPGTDSGAGEAYVIYGTSNVSSAIALSSLDGKTGFRLSGSRPTGLFSADYGISVSNAGDVNGDGYEDIFIGASQVKYSTGASFVIMAKARKGGVYNLGAGFGVETGLIAEWLIDGYGEGELLITDMARRDAFWVDMSKTYAAFDIPQIAIEDIKADCMECGQLLREWKPLDAEVA